MKRLFVRALFRKLGIGISGLKDVRASEAHAVAAAALVKLACLHEEACAYLHAACSKLDPIVRMVMDAYGLNEGMIMPALTPDIAVGMLIAYAHLRIAYKVVRADPGKPDAGRPLRKPSNPA